MPTAKLRIAPRFSLPLDAVTETFAVLAKRGTGKSNAAVVMAEEMYDHGLPWVAVDPKGDWWGVRSAGDGNAPGLSVVVFGGLHGDLPLEPAAGAYVADLVVDKRLTCVLDVSEMYKSDQRRFLLDFAERLYRRNTEPLHIFCEEADEYIPQRVTQEMTKLVGAFETLIKRGRFRGIGITLVTQRSASLNKDVLTQIETLIPMRTPSPQDRKAILDWVNVHSAGAEAVKELPGLENGEAFVFSPQWLKVLQKIKFRRRRTFDSGATPKVGTKRIVPTKLADVDLAAIKEAMSDTIVKAERESPKYLKRRIAELEHEVLRLQNEQPEPERVEVPMLSPETLASIHEEIDTYRSTTLVLTDRLDSVEEVLRVVEGLLLSAGVAERQVVKAPRAPRPAAQPVRQAPVKREPQDGEIRLRSGAIRMLETLGQMSPLRMTKAQWGVVSKMKTSSGTWSTYLGEIRRLGFIDENSEGFTLTEEGFEFIGGKPEPMDARQLQDHYRSILRSGAVRMLDALMETYPRGLTKEELSDISEIASTSGTFSTYVGDLTRNGLAERRNGEIFATDILMFGASA